MAAACGSDITKTSGSDDDDSGSGAGSTSDNTGGAGGESTGPSSSSNGAGAGSSSSSSNASSSVASSSSSGGGPPPDCTPDPNGDPCLECGKEFCCDEVNDCYDDTVCSCIYNCVANGGDPFNCALQTCPGGATNGPAMTLLTCVQSNCDVCGI